MYALLMGLAGTALDFFIKSPIVQKMLIFGLFVGLIASSLSFVLSFVRPHIISNPIIVLASYLGLLQGISLYLTIIIAGFGAKQVLAFVRST
jgi:hypothetical protein